MKPAILVVDDEEQFRMILSRALDEIGGFSVDGAETAGQALQKIQNKPFDLALVDFRLPDTDGLQLITEITKVKPEMLTVLLTGHADIDSAVEAMKRGASDYLTKTVDLDTMLARLRKVLEERRRFLNIRNPLQCFFSWGKIEQMKQNKTEFWAGDGLTRLRIVDISERDRNIFMVTQDGKKTWPLRYEKLEEIHRRVHQKEIALLAYEIDKCVPTWGNYISGLLEYLGCNRFSLEA